MLVGVVAEAADVEVVAEVEAVVAVAVAAAGAVAVPEEGMSVAAVVVHHVVDHVVT